MEIQIFHWIQLSKHVDLLGNAKFSIMNLNCTWLKNQSDSLFYTLSRFNNNNFAERYKDGTHILDKSYKILNRVNLDGKLFGSFS